MSDVWNPPKENNAAKIFLDFPKILEKPRKFGKSDICILIHCFNWLVLRRASELSAQDGHISLRFEGCWAWPYYLGSNNVNEERLGRQMASVHPCPASHTGEQLPGAQLILTSAHVQYLNSDFALCDYCMHGTRAAINSVLKLHLVHKPFQMLVSDYRTNLLSHILDSFIFSS